ncbi:hypothetical protein ACMHYJ_14350 [Castellaniella hirudinis]|uniref:hypothetical protein n=1 Tax=Castellaniella hirudinis TaxID=1144617 RepID=UPI0039C223F2
MSIKMPEPVAYAIKAANTLAYCNVLLPDEAEYSGVHDMRPEHVSSLITTAQAEAYAAAVRREALEQAAKIADQWTTPEQRQFGNGGPAQAIRALIDREGS